MPPSKTPATVIARIADCDPEVVRRVFKGQPVRPRIAARIARALETLGLPWPDPKATPPEGEP